MGSCGALSKGLKLVSLTLRLTTLVRKVKIEVSFVHILKDERTKFDAKAK